MLKQPAHATVLVLATPEQTVSGCQTSLCPGGVQQHSSALYPWQASCGMRGLPCSHDLPVHMTKSWQRQAHHCAGNDGVLDGSPVCSFPG